MSTSEGNTLVPDKDDFGLSLADIMLDFWANRYLMLAIVVSFLSVGILIFALSERSYVYSTTIEIGQKDEKDPIDSAQGVAAKLNESYVPLVLQKNRESNQNESGTFEGANLKARVPKDTNLVVLEVSGKESKSELYLDLLKQVIEMLQKEHLRTLDVIRSSAALKIKEAEQRQQELVDRERLGVSKLGRIDALESLYLRQVSELSSLLKDSIANRRSAYTKGGANESAAMTLMLIDNDTEVTRNRLYEIEKKVQFDLKTERSSLEKELADIKRLQELQAQTVHQAKLELDAVRETRAVIPPIRAMQPKSPGRGMILAIFALIGVLVAVGFVLLRGFLVGLMSRRSSSG